MKSIRFPYPFLRLALLKNHLATTANMTTAAQESLSETVGKTYAVADKESNAWVHGSKTVIARLAAPLLPQMGLTPDRTEPVQWLDNAAGPGVVAQELHALLPRETLEKGSILATDLAEGMVNMLKGRIENEGWVNTEARVLNAQVSRSHAWLWVTTNTGSRTQNCQRAHFLMFRYVLVCTLYPTLTLL